MLERLLHHGDLPVVVRVAQPAPDRVLFGARAATRAAAAYGIERMRFALGVDEDLRPFLRRFARDPLIGRSLRRRPWLRVGRRPEPFEALAWAICEQLIEYERAAAIERRMVGALGRRGSDWDGVDGGLRDLPTAAVLAGTAPALLQSFDLAGGRALALVRAAREVARGRVDLYSPDHERGLAQAARDTGHRIVDGGDARAARPGPSRPGAGRRPGAAEARRAGCSAAAIRTPAPRSSRCGSSSRPTASGPGWRPRTCSRGDGLSGALSERLRSRSRSRSTSSANVGQARAARIACSTCQPCSGASSMIG